MRLATFATSLTLTAGLALGCTEAGPTALDDAAVPTAGAVAPTPASQANAPDAAGVTEMSGTDVVCGLFVEFTVFNAGAAWDAPIPGPPEREARTNVFTLTNPANGKSVSVQTAGRVSREIVAFRIDSERVVSLREVFEGALSHIQTSDGELLTVGSGRLILEFRVIPQQGGDFLVTDLEVKSEAGTTEQAPPLFTPTWCGIVLGALT